MAKSSIHFRAAVSTSEAHNTRSVKLDYNVPELEKNNESLVTESIDDRLKKVRAHCKKTSGRKLQKNAQIIREAVVNLNPETTMEDLKKLANELKTQYGINCFQIYIHRDEGHKNPQGEFVINHHAHMVFDWQDRKTGVTIKLNRLQLSKIQTLVAETLQMERGELRVNSNRERLEPIEYKREQAEKRLQELQEETQELQQQKAELEQKKNTVRERIEALRSTGETFTGKSTEEIRKSLRNEKNGVFWSISEKDIEYFTDEDLERAISIISEDIQRVNHP